MDTNDITQELLQAAEDRLRYLESKNFIPEIVNGAPWLSLYAAYWLTKHSDIYERSDIKAALISTYGLAVVAFGYLSIESELRSAIAAAAKRYYDAGAPIPEPPEENPFT